MSTSSVFDFLRGRPGDPIADDLVNDGRGDSYGSLMAVLPPFDPSWRLFRAALACMRRTEEDAERAGFSDDRLSIALEAFARGDGPAFEAYLAAMRRLYDRQTAGKLLAVGVRGLVMHLISEGVTRLRVLADAVRALQHPSLGYEPFETEVRLNHVLEGSLRDIGPVRATLRGEAVYGDHSFNPALKLYRAEQAVRVLRAGENKWTVGLEENGQVISALGSYYSSEREAQDDLPRHPEFGRPWSGLFLKKEPALGGGITYRGRVEGSFFSDPDLTPQEARTLFELRESLRLRSAAESR